MHAGKTKRGRLREGAVPSLRGVSVSPARTRPRPRSPFGAKNLSSAATPGVLSGGGGGKEGLAEDPASAGRRRRLEAEGTEMLSGSGWLARGKCGDAGRDAVRAARVQMFWVCVGIAGRIGYPMDACATPPPSGERRDP